jgi:hypothetical protein
MSDAVKTDNSSIEPKPESSTGSYIVAALVVLGLVGLAAYQFFSCSTCY